MIDSSTIKGRHGDWRDCGGELSPEVEPQIRKLSALQQAPNVGTFALKLERWERAEELVAKAAAIHAYKPSAPTPDDLEREVQMSRVESILVEAHLAYNVETQPMMGV